MLLKRPGNFNNLNATGAEHGLPLVYNGRLGELVSEEFHMTPASVAMLHQEAVDAVTVMDGDPGSFRT